MINLKDLPVATKFNLYTGLFTFLAVAAIAAIFLVKLNASNYEKAKDQLHFSSSEFHKSAKKIFNATARGLETLDAVPLKLSSEISSINYAGPSEKRLALVAQSKSIQQEHAYIEKVIDYSHLENLLLVRKDGYVEAQIGKATSYNLVGENLVNSILSKESIYGCSEDRVKESVKFIDTSYSDFLSKTVAYVCKRSSQSPDYTLVGILDISKISSEIGTGRFASFSGQTYYLGTDKKLRTDMKIARSKYNVGNSHFRNIELKNEAVEQALTGGSGYLETVDVQGETALLSFKPANILGKSWIVVSEIRTSVINASTNKFMVLTITMLILSAIAILFVSTMISRSTFNPLMHIVDSILLNIDENKHEIQTASSQIGSSGVTSLNKNSFEKQNKEEFSKISNMLNSLNKEIKTTKNNIYDIDKNSETAKELIASLLVVVTNQSKFIEDIKATNHDISAQVQAQSEQMTVFLRDISTQAEVINEIVKETKLLSFNATVEAVQAGESGKGFVVVAQHVGQLAIMSGEASESIEALLSGSRNSIKKMEEKNRESAKKSSDVLATGENQNQLLVDYSNKVKSTIDSIESHVKKTDEHVDSISSFVKKTDSTIKGIKLTSSELTAYESESRALLNNVGIHLDNSKERAADITSKADSLEKKLFGDLYRAEHDTETVGYQLEFGHSPRALLIPQAAPTDPKLIPIAKTKAGHEQEHANKNEEPEQNGLQGSLVA
ncbi:methyl-accepting chemotaxis protein [bacterium]|nr:methyl-accepting chemotaxis protein [bacterium]